MKHHKTKNSRGVMHPFSKLSRQFISFSKDKTVMDMGCAYGNAVIAALENGAEEVVACDMSAEHLQEVESSVSTQNYAKRLITKQGVFPQDFNFEKNSFDAIHISHVLEYLSGEEVDTGLRKCFEWLHSGAKIFILTYTIFIRELDNDKFKVEYEKRKLNKETWPGYFERYDDYCTEEDDASVTDDAVEFPPSMHMFELEVLKTALELIGFTIESASYMSGKENGAVSETWLDGREFLGIVARKP